MKKIIPMLFVLTMFGAGAQEFNEELVVPLTDPGSRGKMEVGLVRGDIFLETYSGSDVIINATARKKDDDDCSNCDDKDERPRNVPAGMKRIASSSIEFAASENDNVVEIETNSWKQAIDLKIKVPENFDLDISTVHGKISINGVSGEMEVSTVHGPLTFTDVSGSIICNTVHGEVNVNFQKVEPDKPMSFVTLHGNVDVTFPGTIKATAKMKSDRGEIFTDFDMEVEKSRPEKKTKEEGGYKVSINSWVYGEVNGGGPEYTFKTMHGDIIIRKK